MKSRSNNKENNFQSDYIKVSHYTYIIDDGDITFLCKTKGYNDYIPIMRESFINREYIISITDIINDEFYLKNQSKGDYETKKLKLFLVELCSGTKYYIPSDEFEKFKSIINYDE